MAAAVMGMDAETIEPLLGQKAWNVALGEGSCVTIEFGNAIPHRH